jgi:Tfp pilus assembly protein PilX
MITRLHTRLRRRLSAQDGSALIIAITTLLVVSTLATVVVATAVKTNLSTRHDAAYKDASEAAEAGLQVAVYRLNMLNPSSDQCVGDAVASPGTNGWCESSPVSMGNGTYYQYYTTPVMAASAQCIGVTITSFDVNQRCVTAVGAANAQVSNGVITGGVFARSQVRSGAFAATPLFPDAGVIGLKQVSMTGEASVTGAAASNVNVNQTGNANSSGIILGPAATYTHSGKASGGTISKLTSPIVLDPVNPGTSNQTSITDCPDRQAAGFTTCNDDYRIVNGLQSPAATPYDQSSGNVTFSGLTGSNPRVLKMSGNSSLTLGGGLYNFCEVDLSGGATLTLAAGVTTEIFIDSPDDPGSGCASGTGNLNLTGGSSWINSSDNPLNMQVYVYGRNNGSGSVDLTGNANMYGVVYAPQSQVTLSGNGTLIGGLAGLNVSITGNGFNWDGRSSTIQATTAGIYYRTGWSQCSPAPTSSSDPGSGCG